MSFLLKVDQVGADYIRTTKESSRPVYYDEQKKKLLVGYVFCDKEREALDCGWEQDPKALQQFDGSMALISWGAKVVLCSDLMGCEKIYYYQGNHSFLVSDDFWDIIREIQPKFSDLDEKNLRARLLVGSGYLSEETVIKGMSILLPAARVEYDLLSGKLKNEQYQLYRFSGEVTDIDEAAKRIGQAIDTTIQRIQERHGDVVYGLGLSGGLDSRLALHYALKNGMRLSCFNVCKKRPNGVLTARSVRLAQKLADLYSVPLTIVEWDPKQIGAVKQVQLRQYPDGPLQEAARDIYKYVPDWKPDFDVLLTGGMGMGQQLFATHYDEKENAELSQIMEYVTNGILYSYNKSMISRGLHVLFGAPIKQNSFRYPWEQKLFFDSREDINRRAVAVAENLMNEGTSYFETIFNIRGRYFGAYSCNGAFESMYRLKPAYSIYSSYVLKEALRFSTWLLPHRGLTRGTIRFNLPEASQIAEEGHDAAPAKINNFRFLRKCMALTDRVIRGDGSHVSTKYWRSQEVWHSFEEDMNSGGKWFWEIMDTDIPLDEVKKTSEIKMTSLWDTKRLLDALETKEYLKWDG